MSLLDDIRLLGLAFWLGAAAFLSFVVAPNVFQVLRGFQPSNANEIAGTVVTRTLSVINLSGFFLSLTLIVMTLVLAKGPGKLYILRIGLLVVIAIATSFGHWIIAARMKALRAAMNLPIDQVTADDPRRLAFDNLHHYSVAALGVAMLAAIVSIVLIRARAVR